MSALISTHPASAMRGRYYYDPLLSLATRLSITFSSLS